MHINGHSELSVVKGVVEDVAGLAAICVLFAAGLFLPILT